MLAAVSSSQSEANKPKVLVSGADNGGGVDTLKTPQNILVTPSEFPSTAEIMQKCINVNPFELKFKEANRKLGSSIGSSHSSQELLEANGLVPRLQLDNSSGGKDFSALLKLPSSMSQSPGIFSNINLLSTDSGELKGSADLTRLVQQMKESGALSAQQSVDCSQAPRTADVLNAVLDMHSDRLHLFNCLNNTAQLLQNLTPAGSAPNSAGILGFPVNSSHSPAHSVAQVLANAVASTSGGGGLVPPTISVSASPAHSPRHTLGLPPNTGMHDGGSPNKMRSPQPDLASAVNAAVQASNALGLTSLPSNSLLGGLTIDASAWDPRDVKPMVPNGNTPSGNKGTPQITPKSDFYNNSDDIYGTPQTSNGYDNPKSNESGVSSTGGSSVHATPSGSGRGRGRGRSTTADMPADERRMTILERNKAAAVRYRKRKKEEHDDMISRVHLMEQEKVQLSTQNQVLRRELERVTALLKERESRCVCMHGIPLSSDVRQDGSGGVNGDRNVGFCSRQIDVLSSPNASFIQHQNLMQSLGMKRQKM